METLKGTTGEQQWKRKHARKNSANMKTMRSVMPGLVSGTGLSMMRRDKGSSKELLTNREKLQRWETSLRNPDGPLRAPR
eukprot:SAG31_NODE_22481_length_524_cov_1.430588_1_plen_79_part_10